MAVLVPMSKVPTLQLRELSTYDQSDLYTQLNSAKAKVLQEAALSLHEEPHPEDLSELTDVSDR